MIDIIILIALIISLIVGAYLGLFRMLSRIIALVCALLLAAMLSQPIATMVYDTNISPAMETNISEKIDDLGVTTVLSNIHNMTKGLQPDKISEYFGDNSMMQTIIPSVNAKKFAETKSEITEQKDLDSKDIAKIIIETIKPVACAAIQPICFAIISTIAYIITRILLHFITDVLDRFQILYTIQKIGGAALSILTTAIICIIIANAIKAVSPETLYGTVTNNILNML